MKDYRPPSIPRSRDDNKALRVDFAVLQQIKNEPDAEERAREHHYHVFDCSTRGEYHAHKREADEAAQRRDESGKTLKELEKRVRGAAAWIDAPASLGGEENRDVPFGRWRFIDRISLLTSLIGCVGLLGMGVANVAVNLLNSGNPIFLEAPWTAILLAMVVPGTAIAAEGIHHFINSSTIRRNYIFAMFSVGLACAGAWTISFAIQFQGVPSGFDWDALASASSKSGHGGSLLVWTQVVAEMCLGAALFMTADQVSRKYWRGTRVQSAERIEANEELARHRPEHDRADTRHSTAAQTFAAIHAAREHFVGQALAALSAIKNS